MKKITCVLLVGVSLVAFSTFAGEDKSTNNISPTGQEQKANTNNITLKVIKADSEEKFGENGVASNAVDGKPNTIWHTQWQDASPEHPHEITVEISQPLTIKGFTYLPRQDDSENGSIKEYEFYLSDDGKEFGDVVTKGAFASGKEKKRVTFEPKKCRFFKLRALSALNGEAWTSAAEIGIIPAD